MSQQFKYFVYTYILPRDRYEFARFLEGDFNDGYVPTNGGPVYMSINRGKEILVVITLAKEIPHEHSEDKQPLS